MGVEANHFLVQRGSMLSIRPATVNDVKLLVTLIRELAEYEKELDAVKITEAQLARDGFGPRPVVSCSDSRLGSMSSGLRIVLRLLQHVDRSAALSRRSFRAPDISR